MLFVQVEIGIDQDTLTISQADIGFGPQDISIPIHQWPSVLKGITRLLKEYKEPEQE